MIDIIRKIDGLVNRAKRVLELDNDVLIDLIEDNIRFLTPSHACELSSNTIYVNKNWIDRISKKKDETELRFLIYHEVRHIYQIKQIELLKNGQSIKEDTVRVMRWEFEMNNYVRNVNENMNYYSQEVEVDANAFGILMFNMDIEKGMKNISGTLTSIPPEVYPLVINRVNELRRFFRFKL